MKNLKDKLNDALVKKAMGYSVEESVCEYGMCDDELKLIKSCKLCVKKRKSIV